MKKYILFFIVSFLIPFLCSAARCLDVNSLNFYTHYTQAIESFSEADLIIEAVRPVPEEPDKAPLPLGTFFEM